LTFVWVIFNKVRSWQSVCTWRWQIDRRDFVWVANKQGGYCPGWQNDGETGWELSVVSKMSGGELSVIPVPQLSILIICNRTWSILIQWINVMIVSWQYDVTIQKKAYLPYHTNKRKGRRLKFCGTMHWFYTEATIRTPLDKWLPCVTQLLFVYKDRCLW